LRRAPSSWLIATAATTIRSGKKKSKSADFRGAQHQPAGLRSDRRLIPRMSLSLFLRPILHHDASALT
jgi:hypothetical protein